MDALARAAYAFRMNPRRPARWSDVRFGALLLLALVPAATGVFFFDALRRAVVEGPTLIVLADEVGGMRPGAEVWVAGKPAGRVAAVSFVDADIDAPGSVTLRVVLRREAAPSLRSDATARIGSSSLLAPPVVKLTPGSPGARPYDFVDTLVVTPAPDIDDFRALADSGRSALNALEVDAKRLARVIETGGGTLGSLRRDPVLVERLARRTERTAPLRAAWDREAGLRGLLADTAVGGAAARIGARLEALADDTAAGRTRRELAETLASVERRTGRLARRIDLADGTLGRLATDDELRTQAARARAALDSLRSEAAADPLRYLRFRLF